MHTMELQLLLHCARSQLDARLIRALVNEGINWDRLLELARQHRVRPLLMRSLKSVCWDAVPSSNASAEVSMGCVPFNSAVSPIRKNSTNVKSILEIGFAGAPVSGAFRHAHWPKKRRPDTCTGEPPIIGTSCAHNRALMWPASFRCPPPARHLRAIKAQDQRRVHCAFLPVSHRTLNRIASNARQERMMGSNVVYRVPRPEFCS
jgi:hypothetical protein